MCLKISVLGHAFDGESCAPRTSLNAETVYIFHLHLSASLLNYEIPEGDVYQSPYEGLVWAALNDSSYDGFRLTKRDSSSGNQRYHLSDGLGVLVDRRIYAGGEIRRALEAPYSVRSMHWDTHQTLSGLVGWFCRSGQTLSPLSPPCQSRNVTLLFTFHSGEFSLLRVRLCTVAYVRGSPLRLLTHLPV